MAEAAWIAHVSQPGPQGIHSLDQVYRFHKGLTNAAAVEIIGLPVEPTSERVSKPGGADLGQTFRENMRDNFQRDVEQAYVEKRLKIQVARGYAA